MASECAGHTLYRLPIRDLADCAASHTLHFIYVAHVFTCHTEAFVEVCRVTLHYMFLQENWNILLWPRSVRAQTLLGRNRGMSSHMHFASLHSILIYFRSILVVHITVVFLSCQPNRAHSSFDTESSRIPKRHGGVRLWMCCRRR